MAIAKRAHQLSVAGITLPLPTFFPSISSVKTRLTPLEYVQVLDALEYPQLLISAYDLHRATPRDTAHIARLLRKATSQRRVILMDSGNYEAFWHRDTRLWTERKLLSVLRAGIFHLAFAFDALEPPRRAAVNLRTVESAVVRAQRVGCIGTIVPIVHGCEDQLPKLVSQTARRLGSIVVAVPERELGEGLIERARTIRNIRIALNEAAPAYCGLHILGTGNPLSILAYAFCGADSFDGLEWCQTAIDSETARPYHFAQWDLLSRQSRLDLGRLPYATRVLTHNLLFYKEWVRRIHESIHSGAGAALLEGYLPQDAAEEIRRIAGPLVA